eukprot:361679-Rhodomonas_salina.1
MSGTDRGCGASAGVGGGACKRHPLRPGLSVLLSPLYAMRSMLLYSPLLSALRSLACKDYHRPIQVQIPAQRAATDVVCARSVGGCRCLRAQSIGGGVAVEMAQRKFGSKMILSAPSSSSPPSFVLRVFGAGGGSCRL